MLRPAILAASLAVSLLAGCDMLGIESPEKVAAAREAEGKAVGGACRHAGRAIEDCYTLNKRVDKAAIFAGWRDMNDYMRENKIEAVAPVLMAQAASARAASEGKSDAAKPAESKAADAEPGATDKPATKARAKDAKSTGS
jgi:hypothetical protein